VDDGGVGGSLEKPGTVLADPFLWAAGNAERGIVVLDTGRCVTESITTRFGVGGKLLEVGVPHLGLVELVNHRIFEAVEC